MRGPSPVSWLGHRWHPCPHGCPSSRWLSGTEPLEGCLKPAGGTALRPPACRTARFSAPRRVFGEPFGSPPQHRPQGQNSAVSSARAGSAVRKCQLLLRGFFWVSVGVVQRKHWHSSLRRPKAPAWPRCPLPLSLHEQLTQGGSGTQFLQFGR